MPIPFHLIGAAGQVQRHRAGHRRRSRRGVDAARPQFSLRHSRSLHTAVDTALQGPDSQKNLTTNLGKT